MVQPDLINVSAYRHAIGHISIRNHLLPYSLKSFDARLFTVANGLGSVQKEW